jgi:hypothetical protein
MLVDKLNDKANGYDYLIFSLTGDVFHDVPHYDNKGRPIVRLGDKVTLPFNICVDGHNMTFYAIGDQRDNMFELRMCNKRMMIYRID